MISSTQGTKEGPNLEACIFSSKKDSPKYSPPQKQKINMAARAPAFLIPFPAQRY